MTSLLDNIIWNALTGPQAKFSTGTDRARRFAPGFSPILGFADPARPDYPALAPFCQGGEHFYAEAYDPVVPAAWKVDEESTMYRMVWDAARPEGDEAADAVPLAAASHGLVALELATLTHPGPFGPRTLELGDYFGVFAGTRLVAMAGERMQAESWREISGVCTDPEFQGRGLARGLMVKLIRRQLARGETPFLHVMRDNVAAHQFYARLGFRIHREVPVRIITRL